MSRLVRLITPAIAAAMALVISTPAAERAFAHPDQPDRAAWPGGPGDRRDRSDRMRAEIDQLRQELGQYQAAYAELSAGLDRIDRVNRRNRDRRASAHIERSLREARDRAGRYVQPWAAAQEEPDWRDRSDWRSVPPPPPPPPGRVHDHRTPIAAMDASAFASLTRQVGQSSFADDKLALVQTAARASYFSVAQVVQLMKLASFDDTRIEIALACAPRVVDGDRWFEVYGALSFSSSRDTLRQRLGGH